MNKQAGFGESELAMLKQRINGDKKGGKEGQKVDAISLQ